MVRLLQLLQLHHVAQESRRLLASKTCSQRSVWVGSGSGAIEALASIVPSLHTRARGAFATPERLSSALDMILLPDRAPVRGLGASAAAVPRPGAPSCSPRAAAGPTASQSRGPWRLAVASAWERPVPTCGVARTGCPTSLYRVTPGPSANPARCLVYEECSSVDARKFGASQPRQQGSERKKTRHHRLPWTPGVLLVMTLGQPLHSHARPLSGCTNCPKAATTRSV